MITAKLKIEPEVLHMCKSAIALGCQAMTGVKTTSIISCLREF
jgi:hypothetical protein